MTSRSVSASCISTSVGGGGLFRTSLKCSVHRASCSASVVSSHPCLSMIGASVPPLYLPHTSLVILPRSPLLAASSAWLARWFMWLHFSVLVILFTVRFASLHCCLYLSFRRSDLTSTTFFLRVLLFAMACQVSSVIHSFLLLCSKAGFAGLLVGYLKLLPLCIDVSQAFLLLVFSIC